MAPRENPRPPRRLLSRSSGRARTRRSVPRPVTRPPITIRGAGTDCGRRGTPERHARATGPNDGVQPAPHTPERSYARRRAPMAVTDACTRSRRLLRPLSRATSRALLGSRHTTATRTERSGGALERRSIPAAAPSNAGSRAPICAFLAVLQVVHHGSSDSAETVPRTLQRFTSRWRRTSTPHARARRPRPTSGSSPARAIEPAVLDASLERYPAVSDNDGVRVRCMR